jgi:hypothetical protein
MSRKPEHEHYPYRSMKDKEGYVFAHICECGKLMMIKDKQDDKHELITLKYGCGCEYDYTTGGIILDEDPSGDNIRLCKEHGRLIPFARIKNDDNETN